MAIGRGFSASVLRRSVAPVGGANRSHDVGNEWCSRPHDPSACLLSQPDGGPRTIVRMLLQFVAGRAAEEGESERDVVARGDLE